MSRRSGFSQATGDYILFLDSDDTLRIDACDLIAKKIIIKQPDIVQFGYREIPRKKNVFSPFYPTSRERILRYLAKDNRYSPEVWTKAYKYPVISGAYNIMDNFYANHCEDVYASIVFSYFAKTYALIKKPLVNYSTVTGMSKRIECSVQTYTTWLLSYNTIIRKTRAFISQYIPDLSKNCLDMEIYLLRDFLYNRLFSGVTFEMRYRLFEMLPSFFTKDAIYSLSDEFLFKSRKHDKYLDFNVSFLSKSKKILLLFFLYIKSFFRIIHVDI